MIDVDTDQSFTYATAFADVYDDLFPVDAMPDGADAMIIDMVGAGPEPRLLEFGVGNGRFLLPLAARGARCTGIDTAPAMLDAARAAAERAGLEIALARLDCRLAGERYAGMDAVLCVGATFGMFCPSDQRAILHSAARCLRPNGVLVIETHNRLAVEQAHRDRNRVTLTFARGDGPPIQAASSFDAASGRWTLDYRWTRAAAHRDATAREFSFPSSAADLAATAAQAGFSVHSVMSDWHGSPFRGPEPRIVLFARTKGSNNG